MSVKTFAVWNIEYVSTWEQSGEQQYDERCRLALDLNIQDAELAVAQLRLALIGTEADVYGDDDNDSEEPEVIGTEKLLSIRILSVEQESKTIDLIVP